MLGTENEKKDPPYGDTISPTNGVPAHKCDLALLCSRLCLSLFFSLGSVPPQAHT